MGVGVYMGGVMTKQTKEEYIVKDDELFRPPAMPWVCIAPVGINVRTTPEIRAGNIVRRIPANTSFTAYRSVDGKQVEAHGTSVWLVVDGGYVYGGIEGMRISSAVTRK